MTGRAWSLHKGVAILAAVLPLAVGGCETGATGLGLNLVSQEQTQDMGVAAWEEIRAQTPVTRDVAMQRRAERVAERVLVGADENPGDWEVVVFRGGEVNAFALPGNKIGVYEGMMDLARSDDELAAVIAHEIAHNEAEHARERLSSQMATQLGIDLASAALGAGTGADASLVAGVLGAGAQYGVILPYSRNQELEADRLGLHHMARAGYDPGAAIGLWEKMRADGAAVPTFLSTHPAPEQRIEQLQAQLPEAMELYRRSQ